MDLIMYMLEVKKHKIGKDIELNVLKKQTNPLLLSIELPY